jgi:hypothetical protein
VIKVVYIAAHSRSGSTLLDRLLGQIPGFVSLGEVRHLWQRGLVEDQDCGCGAPFGQCPFWSAVLTSVFGTVDRTMGAEIAAQLRGVDRVWRIGGLGLARRSGNVSNPKLRAVLGVLDRLYTGLHRAGEVQVLVDSSKTPSYGFLLGLVPGIRLHIVHLVRDSRGVAYSRLRRNSRGELHWKSESMLVARTALEWSAVNGLSWALKASLPHTLVRYEGLVSDPAGTLQRISAACGHERPDLSFLQGSQVFLDTNHTVSGNEMRFDRGWIALKHDDEWRRELRNWHGLILKSMTWPWLKRYGYL